MKTEQKNTETTNQGKTTTVEPMTPEQLEAKQAELQTLSASIEDKEKQLLEKEQELTTKEENLEAEYTTLKTELEAKVEELATQKAELDKREKELDEKEAELKHIFEEGMNEGEVSIEDYLRENKHPDGIQYSEFVLKVTNDGKTHLDGFIRPNPYGGQTVSVKVSGSSVRVN